MKVTDKKEIKIDTSLAEEIRRRSGENVFLCYQCKKCASGCPGRGFMTATPTELMRYVQLGMIDKAMKQNTIWFCMSCQTCSTRCPQDIDIMHVVDTIRIIAQERKIKTDTNNIKMFNLVWMIMLRFMGRMYEIGLIGLMNCLTLRPFKDMQFAPKMFKYRKLKIFPSFKKPFSTMRLFSRAKRLKK